MADAAKSRPLRLSWELHSPVGIERTWEEFANTDRFNRAAGLGFRFHEHPQPDGTVQKTGAIHSWGMTLTFDDLPFQYRAPEWFRKVRRFHKGPATELVTSLRLKPEPSGTSIRYSVEVTPRNALYRPLVAVDLNLSTKSQLTRTFNLLLSELEGQAAGYDPSPLALSAEAEKRLDASLMLLKHGKVARALDKFLRSAPLVQQDRMVPSRLARLWGVDEALVVEDFLMAVHQGILALRWDIMCPSCRAPKQRLESLALLPDEAHCNSCNVRFDGTFPDSVEVSFRPAPAIREFDVEVACLGSPGRHPHIIAQDRIEPTSRVEFSLATAPGPYRIRTFPARETCSLDIYDQAVETPLSLQIGPFDIKPSRIQAQGGLRTFELENVTDRAIDVIIERLWRPADALTAGRLLALPAARALLPEGSLIPGIDVQVIRNSVLIVEVLENMPVSLGETLDAIQASCPIRLHVAEHMLIATYADCAAAVKQARSYARSETVRCAINVGPVMEVKLRSHIIPMGQAIDQALLAVRSALRGIPALPEDAIADPQMKEALAREHATVTPSSYQLPDQPTFLWLRY